MSDTRNDTPRSVDPNLTAIRFALAELEGHLRSRLRVGYEADWARSIGRAIEVVRDREEANERPNTKDYYPHRGAYGGTYTGD
jgi:hypothetical protein